MGTQTEQREQFYNTTGHLVSAVQVSPLSGKPGGVLVRPGQKIWLTTTEQELTAQAPQLDENNPLANGQLQRVTDGSVESARATTVDPGVAAAKAALDAGLPPEQPAADAADEQPAAAASAERAQMQQAPTPLTPPAPPHEPVQRPQPELAATTQPTATTQAPKPTGATPPPSAAGTAGPTEEVATPAAAAKAADAQNAAAHQTAQRQRAEAQAAATPVLDPSASPGEGNGGQESAKKPAGGE